MALNNPYALYFDGVDDWGQLPAAAAVWRGQNKFTIEFVHTPQKLGRQAYPFCDWAFSAAQLNTRSFVLYFDDASDLCLVVSKDGLYPADGVRKILLASEFVAGEPYHFSIVFTGSSILTRVAPVDGEPITRSFAYSGSLYDNHLPYFYLGKYQYGNTYFSQGGLDEIRLWNYDRTQAEIAANAWRYLSGTEAGLAALYRLDTGTDSALIDSTPNENHGTIYGATWVPGLVDLHLPGEVIMSARLIGSSTMTATAQRIRGLSADLRGQATLSATAQRIRGMSANLIGSATLSARMQLVATMRARLVGSATLAASMLVLHVPEGVYVINADEIFSRDRPLDSDCYANHVEVLVKPLVPAEEPEEVYRSQEPIAIGADETKTVSVKYKSTPVIEAAATLENAPAGATIDTEETKYYAWGADVVVTCPAAGTFDLVVEGKPLRVEGEETVIAEDAESIEKWGIKKYVFDSPLVQDRATGEWIAGKLIEMFANPAAPIVVEWRGDPALTLADVALIPEYQRQGLDQRGIYYISKQEIEMAPGFRVKTEGRHI